MTIKDNILSKNEESQVTRLDLFARRFPDNDTATELTLASRPVDYSAATIARAVEDCNAHLINLNVTDSRTPDGNLIVDIRVDHLNGETVARSLERYGYEVLGFNSPEQLSLDEARLRANELLRILDI